MRQYLPLTAADREELLREGRILHVATVGRDGSPHVTPVWYVYLDGRLYFRAQPYKQKIRNLQRDRRVTVVVEAGRRYTDLRGAMVEAEGRVVTEPEVVQRIRSLLLVKYAADRNYGEMPAAWVREHEAEPRVIVELTPTRIRSWDNRRWLNIREARVRSMTTGGARSAS